MSASRRFVSDGLRWRLRTVYEWMGAVFDPIRVARGIVGLGWFGRDFVRYRRMAARDGVPVPAWGEGWPQVHDRYATTPIDTHYFWMQAWAIRRILQRRPATHVDVGSHNVFVSLLSASVPTVFVDYRPLQVRLDGLMCVGGDILALPFADRSVDSLSCLSVAEHIGLGRYGDPLDTAGTQRACMELQRVLRPGGELTFAVPVGRERVRFNACRIVAPATVVGWFPDLELVEFGGVDDRGRYEVPAEPGRFEAADYANGLFCFRRPL